MKTGATTAGKEASMELVKPTLVCAALLGAAGLAALRPWAAPTPLGLHSTEASSPMALVAHVSTADTDGTGAEPAPEDLEDLPPILREMHRQLAERRANSDPATLGPLFRYTNTMRNTAKRSAST
jgi:hypothetical protein